MPFTVPPEIPADRLSYALSGGPVGCLILHGFMGSPKSSRPLAGFLHAQGLTVYCPLLPGHGHLPSRLHQVSHKQWLSAAESAYLHLRQTCPHVFLIAHSMGAPIAAHVAAQQPAVRGLVLLAPLYQMPNWLFALMPALRHVVPFLQPLKFKAVDPRLVYGRLHDFDPGINLRDPEVQAWLPEGSKMPTSALDELRRVARVGRRAWPRVTQPTLVLQGDRDPAAVPGTMPKLMAALGSRDKRLTLFPGAGHELLRPLDPAHRAVWQAIYDFIQAHPAGGQTPAAAR